ncbi:hypothetical protein MNBD_GAMMA22-1068 [hydrothermal vent metagenome]|uniref:Proline rich signal peptide protein n=1 Tax=hydrothermal vent metagenome TaxID=652676 RepID=A0A3B1AP16_9ZZZZ
MPIYIRNNNKHFKPPIQLLALLLVLLLSTSWLHASGFTINSASSTLNQKVYTFNAQIQYEFSNGVLEALDNGIPIFITMEIEVYRERWWRNKKIASLKQTYMLLYHALTEKFVLNNLNSGNQNNFTTLSSALDALGKVKNLPLLDLKLIENGSTHLVKLRTYLDLDSLPGPIRPLAYLSPEWRLESDWYIWSLTP